MIGRMCTVHQILEENRAVTGKAQMQLRGVAVRGSR